MNQQNNQIYAKLASEPEYIRHKQNEQPTDIPLTIERYIKYKEHCEYQDSMGWARPSIENWLDMEYGIPY